MRVSGVMEKAWLRTACASAGSKPWPDAGVANPSRANRTIVIRAAGPLVQIIAPMCSWVVTLPTIDGVRTVVSETGVILSPKYAPEMTAPAVMAGSAPMSGAIATNATPGVAAVVQELPMARPTTPQMMTVAG